MKKLILIILLIAGVTYSHSSFAQDSQNYNLGLGIRLSNSSPTLNNSITVKYFLDPSTALEGLLSFGSRFGIGGLYEIHKPLNFPGMQWYYGAGGYLGFQSNDTYLGPTGIIGLDYKFEKIPLNLSLDWKPELDILPRIAFIPDAFGLSARFTLR
ncbi:MAG: hypothetical protein WKF89_18670 [Chitinophagaceae bacterium]